MSYCTFSIGFCGDMGNINYNPYFDKQLNIEELSNIVSSVKSPLEYALVRESLRTRLVKIDYIIEATRDEDSFCGKCIRGNVKEAYKDLYKDGIDKTGKWRFAFVDYDGYGPKEEWSDVSKALDEVSPNNSRDIDTLKEFQKGLTSLLVSLDNKWMGE